VYRDSRRGNATTPRRARKAACRRTSVRSRATRQRRVSRRPSAAREPRSPAEAACSRVGSLSESSARNSRRPILPVVAARREGSVTASRSWPESRRRLPAEGPESPSLQNQRSRDGRGEGAGDAGTFDRQRQYEEEAREGEKAQEEPAQYSRGGSGALEMVGESGQDRAIERIRREQAGKSGPEHRGETRQKEHEGGRHQHTRRDVPARQRRRRTGFRILRHEDERSREGADHDRHEPGQRRA